MDQQQYCLKWNHHQSNLLKVFSRLLGNEQFTDVLLATEGRTIRCHKVVLSACSTYFENLFMTFEEKNQIVILKDTTYDDIFAIVEFMYRGEINVGQHQLASLLKTAENLKIKGLAEVSTPNEPVNGVDPTPNPPSSGSTSLIPTSTKVTNAIPSSSSSNSGSSGSTSGSTSLTPAPSSPKKPKVSIEPATLPKQPTANLTPNIPTLHIPPSSANGNAALEPLMMKRKRGRPRILDAPGEVNPFIQTRIIPEAMAAPSSSLDLVTSTKIDALDDSSNEPTPGGPLTPERIKELGITKMNEYLTHGTRQQFWEEYYVKVVMQAVRNKEIDMKTGAEILGVSYGTLYGRYRETFGYLKHAWNSGGRPTRISGLFSGPPSMVPSSSVLDAGSMHILEQLKFGKINIRQAAELLKVEPTMLAYELAAKAMDQGDHIEIEDDNALEDYNDQDHLEVEPDVVIHDDLNDEDIDLEDEDQAIDVRDQGIRIRDHNSSSISNEEIDPIATN